MEKHLNLWYTIAGEIKNIQQLHPQDPFVSTPIHTIDSIDGREIFGNPWGNGSKTALDLALKKAEIRSLQPAKPAITLTRSITVIEQLYTHLNRCSALGQDSPIIQKYIELKGIPISEVRENIQAIGDFVHDLLGEQISLRAMLGADNIQSFFASRDVIAKFGIIASGNLGMYDTAILIITGILALAARNGNQLSIIIKPSIYDFLFYDLIHSLPEDVRNVFTRITWRSGEGIQPDSYLMKTLVNGVDGAIYFGTRKSLDEFRDLVAKNKQHHYFYYDHFPIMVITPGVQSELLKETAKLAVCLAYKQKGEACLSLQDIFIHQDIYPDFLRCIMDEWHELSAIRDYDLYDTNARLPAYSKPHLDEITRLRSRLNGAVIGRVYPKKNRTDLLINHEINQADWVLATENAAPFLCLARYSNEENLLRSLETHLTNSTSDKFIYSLIISARNDKSLYKFSNELANISHRVESVSKKASSQIFAAFSPGIPHCGGISFLADMFSIPHQSRCYVKW